MNQRQIRLPSLAASVLALLILTAGCGSRAPLDLPAVDTPLPTPTVAQMFVDRPTPTAAPARSATARPTAAPAATAGADTTPVATPDRSDPAAGLDVAPVYLDGLSTDWTLTKSTLMDYLTRSTSYVAQGKYAIEAKANGNYATLFFTVLPDAKRAFPRDEVVGLRFKLTGGKQAIGEEEIAVAVVGSNSQPYWKANDTSVKLEGRVTEDQPLFSETRLYFLGINRAIEPGEWADVTVWLDDLQYDPDYKYVTGFYLKTDGADGFFIDDVTLLMQPAAAQGG